MNTKMKKELVNDVLTGLVVAATFASVAPGQAMADLAAVVTSTSSTVAVPFLQAMSYICYGLGALLTVLGVSGAKKHADAPGQNALGPALGKIAAGAAFLAAPSVVAAVQQTGTATFGTDAATVSTIGGW